MRPGRPDTSAAALRIAACLAEEKHPGFESVRTVAILLDDGDNLICPVPGEVFLPASLLSMPTRSSSTLLSSTTRLVRRALLVLGITEVDALRLLESHLDRWTRGWGQEQWDLFWDLARESGNPEGVSALLAERDFTPRMLSVRTRAGEYAPLITVLLPGDIVTERSIEDASSVVDTGFHQAELSIIRRFGGVPSPVTNAGRSDEPWFLEYKREALDSYLAALKGTGASPNREYLGFRSRPFAGPATVLRRKLTDEARSRLTHALIEASAALDPWTFCHLSQGRYPERQVPHPIVWLIRKSGLLRTSLGNASVAKAVGPGLAEYRQLLPIAEDLPSTASKALGLPMSFDELEDEHWQILLQMVTRADDDHLLGKAYAAAAADGRVEPPELIRCRVGTSFDDREPAAVAVTADEELSHVFRRAGDPHLLVRHVDDATALVERWGLRSATTRSGPRSATSRPARRRRSSISSRCCATRSTKRSKPSRFSVFRAPA